MIVKQTETRQIAVTREWTDADNYRHLMITGISDKVQEEAWYAGLFERVTGGVEYSSEDDEYFDGLFTDDLNQLLRQ